MTAEPGISKYPLLRDPKDTEECRIRLPDGLVHRVHWDYHNLTACDRELTIVGDSIAAVESLWAAWLTTDEVTCLECLCEFDKTYAQRHNARMTNPCAEIPLGTAMNSAPAGGVVIVAARRITGNLNFGPNAIVITGGHGGSTD